MTTIPTVHVEPGDLIKADLMNVIIEALTSIDGRVSALESKDPTPPGTGYPQVTIASVSPPLARVGDQMTITGTNFDFSVAAASVEFGTALVPNFKSGSSDTKLVFTIPDLGAIPSTGKSFTLKVSNFATSATRTVTVLPKLQVFQGTVDIEYISGTDITAGKDALLQFTATSTGSPAVAVTLSATTSNNLGGITIVDTETPPQPIAENRISIPALGQVPFAVKVPIPSGTATGTNFTLTVSVSPSNISFGETTPFLIVGQAAPIEDPDIKIDLHDIEGATEAGASINVPKSTTGKLTMQLTFLAKGNYDVLVALEPPTNAWKLETDVATPTSSTPSFTIDDSDLAAGPATRTFEVDLTPIATAVATPNLHVTAKHKNGTLTSNLIRKLVPS